MDKNSITGIFLIAIIIIGYNIIYPPTYEQLDNTEEIIIKENNKPQISNSNNEDKKIGETKYIEKSIENELKNYGSFANNTKKNNDLIYLENDKLKISISPLGGRIISAVLKDYKTSDSLPLNLLDKDSSNFNLQFFSSTLR